MDQRHEALPADRGRARGRRPDQQRAGQDEPEEERRVAPVDEALGALELALAHGAGTRSGKTVLRFSTLRNQTRSASVYQRRSSQR